MKESKLGSDEIVKIDTDISLVNTSSHNL